MRGPLGWNYGAGRTEDYVVKQDVTLRDGETVGFSAGQKLPITRSAGVSLDGMTLKLGYPGA